MALLVVSPETKFTVRVAGAIKGKMPQLNLLQLDLLHLQPKREVKILSLI